MNLWSTPKNDTDQLAHISLPLHQPTDLKIVPLDVEDTFYLDHGWELGFDAKQSSQPLVYDVITVRHPDQAISFPLSHVMNGYGITQSPDEQTLLYVHYCDPEGVLTAIAQGSWQYGEVSNYTALSTFDLTTGTENTLFSCDQNAQVVHTSFSPNGSSILFDAFDEAGWHIYRANLEAGALLELVDITPAN